MSGKTTNESEDFLETKKKRRARVREIDFMRVEGSLQDDPLHPFELEVKKRIADASSPLHEIVERETQEEQRMILRVTRNKLTWLLKEVALTAKQREYFELLYIQKLSNEKVAKKLGVTSSTVRRMMQDVPKALHKALSWNRERRRMLKAISALHLTANQRVVFRLRYREGLSVSEIARKLGKLRTAIYNVLARVTKKIS
ncbi:MAG: hypothetical protein A2036_01755 [Omnitrophica bacterium GWA2_50_21]|nr:MAG: hypothetical protein A2036_01755 [Omnitrophica bacterium GWA2_50_21]